MCLSSPAKDRTSVQGLDMHLSLKRRNMSRKTATLAQNLDSSDWQMKPSVYLLYIMHTKNIAITNSISLSQWTETVASKFVVFARKQTKDTMHSHIFLYFRYLKLQSTVFIFCRITFLENNGFAEVYLWLFHFSGTTEKKNHRSDKFSLNTYCTFSEITSLMWSTPFNVLVNDVEKTPYRELIKLWIL